jgi:hypothetical protein
MLPAGLVRSEADVAPLVAADQDFFGRDRDFPPLVLAGLNNERGHGQLAG